MADGSTGAALSVPPGTSKPGWISQFWGWLFGSRSGALTLWIVFALGVLTAILWTNVFGPWTGILDSPERRLMFIGASSVVVLPVLLLFLNSKDNLQNGPSLLLAVLSLFGLVGLTGVAVFDAVLSGGQLLGQATIPATPSQLAARGAFFAFFVVMFIPNMWNAAQFAEFEEEKRKLVQRTHAAKLGREVTDDSDAEATSALITTLIVLLIGVLAYFAGNTGSTLAFESFYGLVLCGTVIGVFAVVVFLDTLAETSAVQALSRAMGRTARHLRFLSAFYNWIDTWLVRIGASVAGMGHETTLRRYGLLAGTLTCLTLLAWHLPPPLGLVPASVGFVIAISVSRLWSWVEDDRALAAMTEYKYDAPYRVGFREDFRDETLLGFIFVFTLLPISMMQAHVGNAFGPNLFDGAENKSFLEWFGFFGVELAKAVPIVDWAEIYNIRPADDLIQFNSPISKHAVFLARATVDLVLIASLLQAIGIASRNRHQKRLFSAGHIGRLDELVERSELSKAMRATKVGTPSLIPAEALTAFDLKKLGKDGVIDFRKYDEARLRHLYWSIGDLDTRSFIAALSADSNRFPLSTAIDQVKEIAAGHKNEVDMFAAFQRALQEHRDGVNVIDADDLYEVLTHLRGTTGLRDFKFKLIDLMVEVGTASEVVDKLTGLAGGKGADSFQYARRRLAQVIASKAAHADREALQGAVSEWEAWAEDSRPNGGDYEVTLSALRAALAAAA